MKNMKKIAKITSILIILTLMLNFTTHTAIASDQGLDIVCTGEYIYGKITNITGNEIEVALLEMSEDDETEPEAPNNDNVEIPMEANAISTVGGFAIDDADNLEFTGETKSLTIPAEVKVYSMGQEIKLSNLKKDDIIFVTVDTENADTVLSVEKFSDQDLDIVCAREYIYGKITNITGNEIEVALVKVPEDNEMEPETPNDDNVEIPMEANTISTVGGFAINDADNLEFTGETKSLTIPAEVKVYSMGQEIKLSNLKKGDIIFVTADTERADTVLSVEKVK